MAAFGWRPQTLQGPKACTLWPSPSPITSPHPFTCPFPFSPHQLLVRPHPPSRISTPHLLPDCRARKVRNQPTPFSQWMANVDRGYLYNMGYSLSQFSVMSETVPSSPYLLGSHFCFIRAFTFTRLAQALFPLQTFSLGSLPLLMGPPSSQPPVVSHPTTAANSLSRIPQSSVLSLTSSCNMESTRSPLCVSPREIPPTLLPPPG